MKILQFVADALGDASYLVVSGTTAAVVDPQRDVRPYVEAAAGAGAAITLVVETHVHNDYVSGGRELAARGAQVVAPADGHLEFPHMPVRDGDTVAIGDASLRAIATPGHTYEHTAYLAFDEAGAIRGAFTGGSLLIAAAGRSDLLGPEHAEDLTRLQWESGHRIASLLPPGAEILPTHGAGSFCSSSGAGEDRRAPLSDEQERNPVLLAPTYEVFRALHLAVSMPIPGYYAQMAPINRQGPKVFGTPPLPTPLTPAAAAALAQRNVPLVDIRSRPDFAAAHVPGSVLIEDSSSLLAYVGWLLPFNSPLGLITYDGVQAARTTVDLFRIGYEDVRGYATFDSWKGAGLTVQYATVATIDMVMEALRTGSRPVLDVRFAYETNEQPIPGALALPIDQLREWAMRAPADAIIICESGQRAAMAASFLQREGKRPAAFPNGGATDILRTLKQQP